MAVLPVLRPPCTLSLTPGPWVASYLLTPLPQLLPYSLGPTASTTVGYLYPVSFASHELLLGLCLFSAHPYSDLHRDLRVIWPTFTAYTAKPAFAVRRELDVSPFHISRRFLILRPLQIHSDS